MSSYPAGWYPDYQDPRQQRYYDGEHWTTYIYIPDVPGDGSGRRRKPPKFRPTRQLVDATYRMLFEDKSMIALLLAGSVVAAAAGGAILFPAMYWGHLAPSWSGGGVLGVMVAGASLGAASFVLQLVMGAVVAAALLRAEGSSATVRAALRIAWTRRRQLLAWALVSTLVGALIRSLERVGLGGFLAALTLNLGWAFATVFAAPVIMVEGTMPLATIRRSGGLIRRQFTVTLVSHITVALPWFVFGVMSFTVAGVGALFMILSGQFPVQTVGALLVALGIVGFCFVSAISSALSAYLEAFLYRHALGQSVPGVDQRWLPPLRPH